MTILGKFSVTSVALAAALFAGSGARAGDDCCKGEKDAAAAAPAGCCGEGAPADKKGECDLGACDAKLAAHLDGVLAKLNAAAPVLAAADAKAVADAKAILMTCPAGRAFTSITPTLLEAVDAIRALDEAVAKTNGLPESSRTKDGGCAFCAEVGKDMPEAARKAMKISRSSIERAQKIAQALAPIAASFPLKGETTKPASFTLDAASFESLSKRVEAATKELAAGLEAASKQPEAERAKIQAAMAVVERHVPAHSPKVLAPAHMLLYHELALANDAVKEAHKAFPRLADEKFVATLPVNAQNAHKLFQGRAHLLTSLAALSAAAGPVRCEEPAKPVSSEPGCCGAEGQQKGAAKPSN